MISGSLQIALHRATKTLPPVGAARASSRQFGLLWVIAACLMLPAEAPLSASGSPSVFDVGEAQVLGVRSAIQSDHSRVIIDLSADIRNKVGHLMNPERVYIDLLETRINPQLTSRRFVFKDGFVSQIRMVTGRGSETRIVLDLRATIRCRVSQLGSPARMLVELSRPPGGAALAEAIPVNTETRAQTTEAAAPNSPGASPQGTPPEPARRLVLGAPRPKTYGEAEKVKLSYAGTSAPRNILLLGLNVGSSYDDSTLGNNGQRVGYLNILFGPTLRLRRDGRRLSVSLSYEPYFRIYPKQLQENAIDQTVGFDATYQASSRLAFRGRASARYITGIFQPTQNEEFLTGIGSPSSLNGTIFTPTVRQVMINSRIDASYEASAHDSLSLFLGQSMLDFKKQVSSEESLQTTEEKQSGLVYQHQLSRHTSLGMDYLFQDIRFGSNSRTLVNSAFFSYAQQFSPSLTLSAFGGPQYSHLNDLVVFSLGPFMFQIPAVDTEWNWAIGGALTKRLDKSVFQVTAQRQVSDGGGLIGAVVSSSVGTSVRRRLPGRWDAIGSAGYANNSRLGSTFSQGGWQSLTAGIGLERSLTEKLALRAGYDFVRQRGFGQSPLPGSLDRDLWSVQLSYRLHQIAFGR